MAAVTEDPGSIPIPEILPITFMVFCRFSATRIPAPSALRACAHAFIETQVNSPLRDITRDYLQLPIFDMQVVAKVRLPAQMLAQLGETTDPAILQQMEEATHCIMIRTSDMLQYPCAGLWTAVAAAMACAQKFHGVVMDPDARQFFPAVPSFAALHYQGMPHLRYFSRILFSRWPDGRIWMTTTGMGRFGLPELQIDDVPIIPTEKLGKVLAGIGEMLIDQMLRQANAQGEAVRQLPAAMDQTLTQVFLQLAAGLAPDAPSKGTGDSARLRLEYRPAKRHPEQRYLTVLPPTEEAADPGDWLHRLVETFFAAEDTFRGTPEDSQAMEAAHRQAIATLPAVRERYQQGQIASQRLGLKFGFPVGTEGQKDHVEYLWVAVTSWHGTRIQGTLVNTARGRNDLHSGQTVERSEEDIFDWLVLGPNGPEEGAYTDQLFHDSSSAEPDEFGTAQALASIPLPAWIARVGDPKYSATIRQQYGRFVRTGASWGVYVAVAALGISTLGAIASAILLLQEHKESPLPSLVVAVIFGWATYVQARKLIQSLRLLRERSSLLKQGEFVAAWIIMANTRLYTPGEDPGAPCLALVALEPRPDDASYMGDLIDRMTALKGTQPEVPDLAAVAQMVTNEAFVANRRRRLPLSFTNGRTVFAMDIPVPRGFLQKGYIDIPILPCLATPGETGAIDVIPWTFVAT